MPIIVDCVRCRRRLEARDEWAGRRVKCPGCGETLTIARPAVPLQAGAAPPAAKPVGPPQARPAGYGAAPTAHPPPRDGLMDLLGAAAPAAAIPRPAAKGAKGRRKTNSKTTVLVLLGTSVSCLVVCGGLALAFLIPFVRGFRAAAARAETGRAAQRPSPLANPMAVPAPGEEPAVASGPIWAPNEQLLNQLPGNAAFDRYSMRLPAGFTPKKSGPKVKLKGGGSGRSWIWMSAPRQNRLPQALNALLIDSDPVPKGWTSELEAAAYGHASSWLKGAGNPTQLGGRPEKGQLAGRLFIRLRFQRLVQHEMMFCTVLAAFDGKRIVSILAVSPDGPETLEYQLLDAATLTFRQH